MKPAMWQAKDGTLVDPPATEREVIMALKRGESPTDEYIEAFKKLGEAAKKAGQSVLDSGRGK